MNRRAAALVLLAVLGSTGCHRAGDSTGAPAEAVGATSAADPSAAPEASVASGGAVLAADQYVFGFTTPPDLVEDPRIVEWAEDPCGETAFAAVAAMPMNDAVLLPDFVVEFDDSGAELRRWGKPYSAEIVAVSGERLHFRARHENDVRVFWTQPDGAVGLLDDRLADPSAPRRALLDGAATIDCPALPVFSGSDYVRCHQITDDAGTRRLLAWEGACS